MTAKLNRGFTLVELLIVIAIIGVLAVVVLIAINPVQQLARTRDSGRESGVTQLGHAIEAYATGRNGIYVRPDGTTDGVTACAAEASWAGCLVDAGEVSLVPGNIPYSAGGITTPCTAAVGNGGASVNGQWCYKAAAATGTAPAIVYARMESTSNRSRCAAGSETYFVYSTADGRGGIVCRTAAQGEPAVGNQTFEN